MYPYGKLTGMSVADEENDQVLRIPDASVPQVLAFMEKDPSVQDNIGFIKANFDKLGTTPETKHMIAQNFAGLTKENKERIRALANGTSAYTPGGAGDQSRKGDDFLFYKHPAPQPTIETDKKSTMVKVNNPPMPGSTAGPNQPSEALSQDQIQEVQKIVGAKNYTPEVKRSAIYNYLIKYGYDPASAKANADAVYQSLIGKK
jgi:hypothetical protein